MRIMVVGDGKVGHTIAAQLALEKHDVVIIDTDEEVLHRSEDELDVLCIHGNGANAATLAEAGAEHSDIIIATTDSDEVNMLCCLMAKHLGTRYAIARIRDPEYNESISLLKQGMGIDLAVNPERATALEISRLLRFPFASTVESFAKGRVEMAAFRAQAGDPVVGVPLKEINSKNNDLPRVLYAVVERNGDAIIPHGDFVVREGDRVHVAGDLYSITTFFKRLGRNENKIRNVMMLGGGKISYYLARILVPMGIKVNIVEIDEQKAAVLSETLPETNVICGDGTERQLLEEEGLEDSDAFIGLSNRDEENLMTGLFAVKQGVRKVIVKINRTAYEEVITSLGLDSMVSPKAITCANLLRYVRGRVNVSGAKVERLYRLADGHTEALEFIARAGDSYVDVPLKDLDIRPETLVAVIVRGPRVIVPFGNDHIEAGDHVVIITGETGIGDLNEVIRK